MNAKILSISSFNPRPGRWVLTLSLISCLAVVGSLVGAEEDPNLTEASEPGQLNFDEQEDKMPDRPFVADPDDGPDGRGQSWASVRLMPDDFRISAMHELERLQETLRKGATISVMKWKRRHHSQDVYVEQEAIIDGRHVRKLRQDVDPSGNSVLEMKLSEEGSELFSRATREMIGRRLAVIFHNELLSVPLVRHEVTGGTVTILGLDRDVGEELVDSGGRRAAIDPDWHIDWTDMRKIRMIAQASLIFAHENRERLPGPEVESIYEVARMLAREGGLNDASIWFSEADGGRSATDKRLSTVLDHSRSALHPLFAVQEAIAFDYATGLTTSMRSTTPVAWTRGLGEDGTWGEDGAYGSAGGFIVFLGGNVRTYRELTRDGEQLVRPDGTRTSNILEALPPEARVVGSGPGTLHGSTGVLPE